MGKVNTIGTFDAINQEAPVFEILRNDPPSWWTALLRNKDIYVEVRKDNYLNMYYEGGCIAKVRYCSKHKKVQAIAHEKYIGIKDGTKYRNIADELETKVDSMLALIQENYSRKNGIGKEKMSEKLIQSKLITKYPTSYIDSEFAYRIADNELLRFDLVECDTCGRLKFVELKRIDDARMLNIDDTAPEVVAQIQKYRDFIQLHEDELLAFYQKVYDIKSSLHLPVPNVRPTSIIKEPYLYIFDRWEKATAKRATHTTRMRNVLDSYRVWFDIYREL